MREIKFRAWDAGLNKNGKYWTWDLLLKHDLVREAFINKSIICEQYTGLKDKNGKEIYEGDIVNVYEYLNGEIWTEHRSSVVWENVGFDISDPYCGQSLHGNTVEVIGNIHENPELLK